MPKYLNTSTEFVPYAGGIVLPEEYVDVPYYINDARLVLQSTTSYPVVDTVLVDESVVVAAGTAVTGEAIGTGDGETLVFYLDNYGTAGVYAYTPTIYVDGVEVESGVTVDLDGTVTFDVAPGDTLAITADYTSCTDSVLNIPYTASYELTLLSESGIILTRFGGAGSNSMRIDENIGYSGRLKWGWCNHLRFTSVEGGTVRVVSTVIHPM